MSDFRSQEAGTSNPRGFTLVKRADGSPITAGTVNWYAKCIAGANVGKWWKDSDQTWAAVETANAMTHQADGHWTRALAASPWIDGDVMLEYAKENSDLHVPVSRMLKVEHTPGADSSRRADLGSINGASLAGNDAVLNLKQLSISNPDGSAILAQAGNGGHGIEAIGQGAGAGLRADGGATGAGLQARGGATAGHGLRAEARGIGAGIAGIGHDGQSGIIGQGAPNGYGFEGVGDGAADWNFEEALPGEVWANPERTLTQPVAQIEDALDGADITLRQSVTGIVNLTGLGDIAGRQRLWITAKRRDTDTDEEALLQVEETDGLLVLDGADPTTETSSIVVTDEGAGNLTWRVEKEAAAALPWIAGGAYDVKVLTASGEVFELARAAFAVGRVVTQAIE